MNPQAMCIEEHMLKDVNLLNRSQYVEELVSSMKIFILEFTKNEKR